MKKIRKAITEERPAIPKKQSALHKTIESSEILSLQDCKAASVSAPLYFRIMQETKFTHKKT